MKRKALTKQKPVLLIDCSSVFHRLKYAMKDVIEEDPEGPWLADAFMCKLGFFYNKFHSSKFVFCWDSRKSKRKQIYPVYKQKEYSDEEREFNNKAMLWYRKLRKKILPGFGFMNSFRCTGYEADDVMALCACRAPSVIISDDDDMLQCITSSVSVYNPGKKKLWNMRTFKKEKGINPSQWDKVKAIAGCRSDNIKGIEGIGEARAISYMCSTLSSSYTKKIEGDEGQAMIKRNMQLVKLPFDEDMKIDKYKQDQVTLDRYNKTVEEWDLLSLTHIEHALIWENIYKI